jgi:RES domain-containing protein
VETFVHIEPNLIPADLVSIEGEFPASLAIRKLDPATLPAHWYESRDESLQRFGDDWIRSGETAAMLAPSAAIRGEWNVLLNPAHTAFSKIRFKPPEPFVFDARMFR